MLTKEELIKIARKLNKSKDIFTFTKVTIDLSRKEIKLHNDALDKLLKLEEKYKKQN